MTRRLSRRPQRTCLGCMRSDDKDRMIRLAVDDERIVVDGERRLSGRGGYLHGRDECLARFVRSKVKEFRSLRRKISLDERVKMAELIQARLASQAALK